MFTQRFLAQVRKSYNDEPHLRERGPKGHITGERGTVLPEFTLAVKDIFT